MSATITLTNIGVNSRLFTPHAAVSHSEVIDAGATNAFTSFDANGTHFLVYFGSNLSVDGSGILSGTIDKVELWSGLTLDTAIFQGQLVLSSPLAVTNPAFLSEGAQLFSGNDVTTGGTGADSLLVSKFAGSTTIGGAGSDVFYVYGGTNLTNQVIAGGTSATPGPEANDLVLTSVAPQTFDFSVAGCITEITRLTFLGPSAGPAAIFGFSQFGAGKLSPNLVIQADSPSALISVVDTTPLQPASIDLRNLFFNFWDTARDVFRIDASAAGVAGAVTAYAPKVDTTILGGSGSDILHGGDGNDTLSGGGGNDVLDGGRGDNTIAGNAGIDAADYSSTTLGVNVDLAAASNQATSIGGGVEAFTDQLATIEDIIGGSGDDILTGDAGANTISGRLGANHLNGGGGIDTADYSWLSSPLSVDLLAAANQASVSSGPETFVDQLISFENIVAGIGNDTVTGDTLANVLRGGAGNDTLDGGAGNDTLDGGAGFDELRGGTGDDTYVLGNDANLVVDTGGTADLATTASTRSMLGEGLATIERLTLLSGNIDAIGNNLNNVIIGSAGANTINGGLGNDTLSGGAGADKLYGDAGNDALDGGAGFDELRGGLGNDTYVLGNDANLVVDAGGTADLATTTSTRSMTSSGLTTIERLTLVSGNINGTGNNLANIITGSTGNNILRGGRGNDTLSAGTGSDTLYGEIGVDRLTGGAGKDAFVFNVAPTFANRDTITDFSHRDDTIKLAHAFFKGMGTGPLKAQYFFAGTHAHDADDRIIYNKAAGALYYDSDGNGAHAQVLFAVVANHATAGLAFNDFALI